MNLASVIQGHDSDRLALIEDDHSVTFGELRGHVSACQAVLEAHEIGVDDAVALAIGNDINFVVSMLAVLGRGGIVMPLNPTSPVPEMRRKLDVASPKLLILGQAGAGYVGLDNELGVPTLDRIAFDPG
jgi:long-chain acyl-CoA synthetase